LTSARHGCVVLLKHATVGKGSKAPQERQFGSAKALGVDHRLRAPTPPPTSIAAPHRADRRPSRSAGGPASPRNATGNRRLLHRPAAASPSLIDHRTSESKIAPDSASCPLVTQDLPDRLKTPRRGAQVELGCAKFAFGTTGSGGFRSLMSHVAGLFRVSTPWDACVLCALAGASWGKLGAGGN
jgi:hypothetical protein